MKIRTLFSLWRLVVMILVVMMSDGFAADEIHWTITGQTSVAFDWRGTSAEKTIVYGTSPGIYLNGIYTNTFTKNASNPVPLPTSSSGPFWEAKITNLQNDTLYYYSIANGPQHKFRTPPSGYADFIVYVEGDIGSTKKWSNVAAVQKIIGNVYGNGFPVFSLLVGDLSYGDVNGMDDVDQHFNDVMLWSQDAAYMPAWGNHEWQAPDRLNNYEGRFALPNSFTSPGASNVIGNGPDEDWYWFDYGNVRFIAFPERYSSATRSDWNTKVKPIMAAAQADSNIDFIVTFGHSPAYSCTTGNAELKGYLDGLAIFYSKYVLNVTGHHHFYERSDPTQTYGVTHVIAGTGHTNPTTLCTTRPSWSAFYTKQPGALKLHFAGNHIDGQFICAPASTVCTSAGTIVDSFTIGILGADNTPPSVSITAPAAEASVSGTISVSASASDNIGVTGVQFRLDGNNLGSQDTTAPYSTSWNTSTVPNGVHALTAVARDAAGNTTISRAVSVTVKNSIPPGGTPSLTHQWKFDESSGTTALDSAGTNNATLSNSLWVTGKTGNAASFNGTNASGNAGKIGFGTSNFTVVHWVKVDSFKSFAGIFNNRSSASGNIGFHTRTDSNGTFKALIDFGSTSKNLAFSNAVPGTWYHVAVSVDRAGLMKLYVNGVLSGQVSVSAFSAISLTHTDNVRLGRDQASNYFKGAIDDLRLYNSALSAAEILSLYNQ